MDERMFFVAAALTGLVSRGVIRVDQLVPEAIRIADATIAELNKPKPAPEAAATEGTQAPAESK